MAHTDRSGAAWQSATALAFMLVFAVMNRRSTVRYGSPDIAIPIVLGFIVLTGWYRTTRLSDKARRDALELRDVLLSVLPNASLVDVPEELAHRSLRS